MKNLAFKLLIALTAFLVFFIIIELGLRIFDPIYLSGDISYYKYDEELGFSPKESVHYYKTTDFQAEFLTNQYGTINFQEYFDEYETLVFTLGDSYTEGAGVPRDASYPFQLDLMLNFEGGKYQTNYAVVNAGLSGYGGKQSLIVLKQLTENLGEPQYILYFGNTTDYRDDLLFDSGYKHRHLVDSSPHWKFLLKPIRLVAMSQIGIRVKLLLGRLRLQIEMESIEEEKNNKLAENNSPIKSVAEKEEPIFDELLRRSKELDAELIVSWSSIDIHNQDSYLWLKNWAKENNVKFADWYPKAQSVLSKIPRLPTNNDHSVEHYRIWVNTIIARSFAEEMLNQPPD